MHSLNSKISLLQNGFRQTEEAVVEEFCEVLKKWCLPVITPPLLVATPLMLKMKPQLLCLSLCMCVHINISAEWHTMVGSKLPPPTLQQQFMSSSTCQILSFFLNEVLICLETLQSSPAVVPVALREHRVGSLLLSQAWRTKRWPLLSLCGGQWKKGRKKRSPTLSWGPEMTQTPRANMGPSLQTTQNYNIRTCSGK